MHKSCLVMGAAALAAAFSAGAASAEEGRFALGAGVGTAGLEGQAAVRLSDRMALRASGNVLDLDRSQSYDGVDYDAQLDASTLAGFVDVRPFANAFTLSGGAYLGSREASLAATPTSPVEIGDMTFTPAEIGSLVGGVDLGDVAPYLGAGFDNTFTRGGRLGFRLSAGVALGSDPDVSLDSVGGTLSGDPTLQNELAKEEANVSDDARILKYYPVVSAGLFVTF